MRRKPRYLDVVIPYSPKPDGIDRLKICLRAMKNLIGVGHVFIVTDTPPSWLNTERVKVIPCDDEFSNNKDGNMIQKVMGACQHPLLSDRFIRMSDDQLFLKTTHVDQLETYYRNTLDDITGRAGKNWMARMDNTKKDLRRIGKDIRFYDLHCPQVCDKEDFLRVYSEHQAWRRSPGVLINSFYFNVQRKINAVPEPEGFLYRNRTSSFDAKDAVQYRILEYSPQGIDMDFIEFLHQTFNKPCIYEI